MPTKFKDIVSQTLSVEQISDLHPYRASTAKGNIVFLPIVKGYGREVIWEARTHIKGVIGPLPATEPALQAIEAPADWVEKIPQFLQLLQERYPTLPATFPQLDSAEQSDARVLNKALPAQEKFSETNRSEESVNGGEPRGDSGRHSTVRRRPGF